ncbi:hypothetical protein FQZ97_1278120 [compost metagenome]
MVGQQGVGLLLEGGGLHAHARITDAGIVEIRAAIREEQKHRRESSGYWIGMLIGVIGALSGLVAAFK